MELGFSFERSAGCRRPMARLRKLPMLRAAFGGCDAAGVFAHAHIAHAVGSVFNRIPAADDGIEEFAIAGLGLGATAHIVGDFCFGELLGFGEGEVDGGALDGDEAPTPREPDVLRSGGEGFDAAAHEFAVPFVARGVTLGRKKSR